MKKKNNIENPNKLLYFRLILFVGGFAYLVFGWIYQSYISGSFPMPMSQRICASAFFLSIFGLTYLSKWSRSHIEELMYLAASGAISHLAYFAFINNYRLNYSLSLLIVIILVNFLFRGTGRLKWFNLLIDAGIISSLYLGTAPSYSRFAFAISVVAISAGSYLLSKSKRRVEEEYARLFYDSPVGIVKCGENGEILEFNREMARLAGDPDEEQIEGLNVLNLLQLAKSNLNSRQKGEEEVQFPWGHSVWVVWNLELIPPGSDSPRNIIFTFNDVSSRKEAEEEIEHITYHDDLTQLYNRNYFEQKSESFESGEQHPLSLLFIDVDKLKLVNDAFGHMAGDRLLVEAGDVIQESCREEDLVFRWGGDEIVVLLPGTAENESEKVSARIRKKCEEAQLEPIGLMLSIGRATEEEPAKSGGLESLLKKAEENMYENKMEKQDDVSKEILSSITGRLERRTHSIMEHSRRVKELALRLGEKLGLEGDQLEKLGRAAKYHDIGKVSLDDEILTKNYREMSEDELEQLRGHSEIGYQIAKELHETSDVALPILEHHEWWDGTGYPQGKSGEEISYASRIIAVVNYYAFLTCPNCNFRDQVDKDEAKKRIKDRSGTQFQPEIAEAFLEMI